MHVFSFLVPFTHHGEWSESLLEDKAGSMRLVVSEHVLKERHSGQ